MPSGPIPFCGSRTSISPPCAAKASAQTGALPFSSRFRPQTTTRRLDRLHSWWLSRADSANAFATVVPPETPSPLLLSLRTWNVRLWVRKRTMGSADRPPNALSERLSSTSVRLSCSASHIADRDVGISVISRPVNISARSATCH